MAAVRMLSWNVNGIRAVEKKGFSRWLAEVQPDFLCVQEIKARPDQLSGAVREPPGYRAFWHAAERAGYSGVAVFAKQEPQRVAYGWGDGGSVTDREGRLILLEYERFVLFNIYFPNGKSGEERLSFKLGFYRNFLERMRHLRAGGKTIIVCGDFNTAHQERDLARPKENSGVSGFLPQERALIDRFIELGFCDSFRAFNQQSGRYTWWDLKSRARERNVGWRIDYFFIDEPSLPLLKDACICDAVHGSDHCPVGITVDLPAGAAEGGNDGSV
ncbi:MAG: exodeoxyribonuclease III [Candidatus Omnitrophica bacterium]|nr:exodeoxyribonuclease III [Candidatus Omnitrophota bacterium]